VYNTRVKLASIGLRNTPLILFAIVFIVFGIVSPNFFKYQSLENAVKQASYIGIVAVGMTFVLLTAGIDLSVGSNMYLSAATAGLLINYFSIPAWLALIVCLLVGFGFGLVNAVVVTRFGVIPFVIRSDSFCGYTQHDGGGPGTWSDADEITCCQLSQKCHRDRINGNIWCYPLSHFYIYTRCCLCLGLFKSNYYRQADLRRWA